MTTRGDRPVFKGNRETMRRWLDFEIRNAYATELIMRNSEGVETLVDSGR